MAANSTRQVTDTEVMEFYNLATSKILTGLEVNKHFPQHNNVDCGFIHLNKLTNFFRKIYQKPKMERISKYY